jgi:hypothetical protein
VSAFRNTPIDRRRLSYRDRSDFNQSGAAGAQQLALKRAKAYKGQMAYRANTPINTTTQRPGTGGQSAGIGIQQMRMMDLSAQKARQEELRPEMVDPLSGIYRDNTKKV